MIIISVQPWLRIKNRFEQNSVFKMGSAFPKDQKEKRILHNQILKELGIGNKDGIDFFRKQTHTEK